ncbi:hypothetical protein C7B76_12550 [filamentous cyanobacterium CCP2]|nr:hypothetical protein C7B76_12550 [filamentous cyanobacterium CCP2]
MMSVTHAAIATATTSISLGTANAFILGLAVLGSQLPDLDSTESWIGRLAYPIAHYIEERYPHRTITHSFLSTLTLAILAAPLLFLLHWHYWAALMIGQFTGWFADAFTRSGVAAFYPNPARLVIPGNPRARLRSQSPQEYWVLSMAVFLCIASINLTSNGGIVEQFAKGFFQDAATAVQLFQKYGSERLVTVEVKGLQAYTSQAIEDRYTVIETTLNDLIAESQTNGRLYKIGNSPDAQIRPSRVKVQLDNSIAITSEEVLLKEILVADWLKRVPQNAYVSGSLVLEDSREVTIATDFSSYDTIHTWGGQLELRNARPAQILAQIGEFWIVQGKAIVKVRQL